MFLKRLLPLLCCLLLLPFHMAWAETSDAAPVTVAYGGQSIVAQADAFYCMLPHEDGIHRVLARYDPVSQAVTPLQTLVSAWLMPSAEGLLVLDSSRNGIYALQGPKLLPLYTLTEEVPQELWFADSPIFAQGQVFFLYGSSAKGSMLYAFDPETETLAATGLSGLSSLTLGPEGLLYAFRGQHIVSLSSAQPTAAQEVAEVSMFADGLAYDASSDTLYWVDEGMLHALRGGTVSQVRALTLPTPLDGVAVCGDWYLVVDGISAQLRAYNITEAPEQAMLTIRSSFRASNSLTFSQAYPELYVNAVLVEHLCAEEVFTAIQTGDDTTDIFGLTLDSGVRRLMERGYLAPLSDAQVIAGEYAQMYPAWQAALALDGEIYAVLSSAIVQGWSMRDDLDGRVTPPSTVEELISDAAAWADNPANPGVPWVSSSVYPQGWGPEQYGEYLFDAYVSDCLRRGEAVDFSREAFAGPLALLREVAGDIRQVTPAKGESSALTVREYYLNGSNDGQHYVPAPGLTPEASALYPVRAQVYVVNPRSPRQAEAKAYLEDLISNRMEHDAFTQLLCPGESPRRYASHQAQIDDLRATLSELEALTESAASPDPGLEQRMASVLEELQILESDLSAWQVYEPFLNLYEQEVAPNLGFAFSPMLETSQHTSVREDMLRVLSQCVQGQSTVEACVNRLNDMARAITLEN